MATYRAVLAEFKKVPTSTWISGGLMITFAALFFPLIQVFIPSSDPLWLQPFSAGFGMLYIYILVGSPLVCAIIVSGFFINEYTSRTLGPVIVSNGSRISVFNIKMAGALILLTLIPLLAWLVLGVAVTVIELFPPFSIDDSQSAPDLAASIVGSIVLYLKLIPIIFAWTSAAIFLSLFLRSFVSVFIVVLIIWILVAIASAIITAVGTLNPFLTILPNGWIFQWLGFSGIEQASLGAVQELMLPQIAFLIVFLLIGIVFYILSLLIFTSRDVTEV